MGKYNKPIIKKLDGVELHDLDKLDRELIRRLSRGVDPFTGMPKTEKSADESRNIIKQNQKEDL